MTKGDLAKKQEAERAEWRRRGILGVITALKPDTKEITISNRTMAGTQSVVIPVSDKTEMRRYAPDSIRFSDAKPSSFTELKVGDQLRALGDRTEDPLKFNPQKVVTGSFRTVGGVVTAIDPTTGEIHIKDLEKKTPLSDRYQAGCGFAAISCGNGNDGLASGRPGGQGGALRRWWRQRASSKCSAASARCGGPGGRWTWWPASRWRIQYQRHA